MRDILVQMKSSSESFDRRYILAEDWLYLGEASGSSVVDLPDWLSPQSATARPAMETESRNEGKDYREA